MPLNYRWIARRPDEERDLSSSLSALDGLYHARDYWLAHGQDVWKEFCTEYNGLKGRIWTLKGLVEKVKPSSVLLRKLEIPEYKIMMDYKPKAVSPEPQPS